MFKVISLPHRKDRQQHVSNQLQEQGIDFEFVSPAAPLPSKLGAGNASLVLTTYNLVKQAVLAGTGVAIIEDDIILTSTFKEKLQTCVEQLPTDWDMLYFTGQVFENWGSMRNTELHPYSENLLIPKYLLGTQGYMLSKPGASKLYMFLNKHITALTQPIDVLLGYDFILNNTCFVCNPFLMKEAALGSDISVEWDKSFTYKLWKE